MALNIGLGPPVWLQEVWKTKHFIPQVELARCTCRRFHFNDYGTGLWHTELGLFVVLLSISRQRDLYNPSLLAQPWWRSFNNSWKIVMTSSWALLPTVGQIRYAQGQWECQHHPVSAASSVFYKTAAPVATMRCIIHLSEVPAGLQTKRNGIVQTMELPFTSKEQLTLWYR